MKTSSSVKYNILNNYKTPNNCIKKMMSEETIKKRQGISKFVDHLDHYQAKTCDTH